MPQIKAEAKPPKVESMTRKVFFVLQV